MNSVPSPFPNFQFQSAEDLLAFLLMYQKGLVGKDICDVIFPMLLQLSDHQLKNMSLSSKNFTTQSDIPEKFKFLLQNIKSENSTNDLKSTITIKTEKGEIKKVTKEHIDEWIAKLKEHADHESIKDHTVTKSAQKEKSSSFLSPVLKKEKTSETEVKKTSEQTKKLEKESISKKDPLFERKAIESNKNLYKQEVVEKQASKQAATEPLKEPLKALEPKSSENTKHENKVIKESSSNTSQERLGGSEKQKTEEDNYTSFPEAETSLEEDSFEAKLSSSDPSGTFPLPFWKENKIASYIKDKARRRRVEKKEEARNGHEKEKELDYFNNEDEV